MLEPFGEQAEPGALPIDDLDQPIMVPGLPNSASFAGIQLATSQQARQFSAMAGVASSLADKVAYASWRTLRSSDANSEMASAFRWILSAAKESILG